jgi:hypothetical protein
MFSKMPQHTKEKDMTLKSTTFISVVFNRIQGKVISDCTLYPQLTLKQQICICNKVSSKLMRYAK